MSTQLDAIGGEQYTNRLQAALAVLLRVIVVTVTLYPAVRKFTEYSYRVAKFEAYGLPWPAFAVPVTGVVEILAIVAVGVGIAGRLGAGALVVGMVVAIVAAGPNPFNVLVLVASVGIVLLGTGPYSYWDPTTRRLLGSIASIGDGVRSRVGG
jgi:uncharacterized membrane protein YphA (DoxX/SURF4 family)